MTFFHWILVFLIIYVAGGRTYLYTFINFKEKQNIVVLIVYYALIYSIIMFSGLLIFNIVDNPDNIGWMMLYDVVLFIIEVFITKQLFFKDEDSKKYKQYAIGSYLLFGLIFILGPGVRHIL